MNNMGDSGTCTLHEFNSTAQKHVSILPFLQRVHMVLSPVSTCTFTVQEIFITNRPKKKKRHEIHITNTGINMIMWCTNIGL